MGEAKEKERAEARKREALQERANRHRAIAVVADAILDALAEAVHQVGGAAKTPALDRLTVLIGGYVRDDSEGLALMGALPLIALAIAERTHPAPSEATPARDALLKFVTGIDDKENGFEPEGEHPTG